jgi:hypothetical protein
MDARLGFELQGILHLVKRRRNTGRSQPLVDKEQQLALLLG